MGQQVFKSICECCGKEFESLVNPENKNRRKFCSKTCSAKVQHEKYRSKYGFEKGGKRPNYTGKCKNCGEEFTRFVPTANLKKALFCSNSCKSLYQWKDRKLTNEDKTKVCEYCGEDFIYCKGHKEQRFCSLKCANQLNSDLKQKNNRNLVCEQCGKKFVRNLTDKELAKGKGKYCSHKCYSDKYAWKQLYCEQCGSPLKRGHGDRFCSHKCSGLGRRLKDGHTTSRGYVIMTIDDGRRIAQHRYVMEQMLGRPLFAHEKVHHKDGVKTNNEPDNLEIWLNGHPGGQRLQDINKKDVVQLALKTMKLEQELETIKDLLNQRK